MAWIEFTQGEGNSPLLVNMDRIDMAVRNGSGATLFLTGSQEGQFHVNQSLDEVKAMLAEAEGF